MSGYGTAALTDLDQVAMFNQLDSKKSTNIFRKASAAYNIMQGTPMGGENADGFTRDEKVDGHKITVTVIGTPRTLTGIADGSAERATANLTALDGWVEQSLDIAHIKDVIPLEESKMDRFFGTDTAKFANFIDEVFDLASESQVKTISEMLHATGSGKAPSRTVIGSMWHAVSDGTEANYDSYLDITRSDAGNTDFRCAYLNGATGRLSRREIGLGMTNIEGNLGTMNFGLSGVAVYQTLRELFEGFLDAEIDGEFVNFGGGKVRYAGCTFMLDKYSPAGGLLAGDSKGWRWKRKEMPRTREGIVRDPSRVATFVLHWGGWYQGYCREVRKQVKWMGIA